MLRRLFRIAALLALCALLLPLALVSRILAWSRAERAALRLAAATQRSWGRGILTVLGVEVELVGTLPAGACLVVANHLSYLDIPLLAAHIPARFVAKSEIAGWAVLGHLAATVGTIFLVQNRRRDVLRVEREMARTLAAGVSVVLFPEGHSTRGLGVDRMHSSLLECAASGRIPCLAVALGYETPADPWAPAATICWWGGMGFGRHAWGVLGLRRVRARLHIASRPRQGSERKALAEALRSDVLECFVPVRQAPIAPDYPWPELFLEGPALSHIRHS